MQSVRSLRFSHAVQLVFILTRLIKLLFKAHVIPANLPGKIQERNIRIQNLGATGKIAETTGGMVFPEEISATLEIDGWEAKTVQARRTKKQRLPVVEEIGFYETKKKKMVAPVNFVLCSDMVAPAVILFLYSDMVAQPVVLYIQKWEHRQMVLSVWNGYTNTLNNICT